jgi:hypothetical protein
LVRVGFKTQQRLLVPSVGIWPGKGGFKDSLKVAGVLSGVWLGKDGFQD